MPQSEYSGILLLLVPLTLCLYMASAAFSSDNFGSRLLRILSGVLGTAWFAGLFLAPDILHIFQKHGIIGSVSGADLDRAWAISALAVSLSCIAMGVFLWSRKREATLSALFLVLGLIVAPFAVLLLLAV